MFHVKPMYKYNFSIAELTKSGTAAKLGMPNTPTASDVANMWELIETCLQPAREKYGAPIRITSGFRSKEVNRVVGGSTMSQHCTGEAADMVGLNNTPQQLKEIARACLDVAAFDQLILETNSKGVSWVHISHKARGTQRREVLIYTHGRYSRVTVAEFLNAIE